MEVTQGYQLPRGQNAPEPLRVSRGELGGAFVDVSPVLDLKDCLDVARAASGSCALLESCPSLAGCGTSQTSSSDHYPRATPYCLRIHFDGLYSRKCPYPAPARSRHMFAGSSQNPQRAHWSPPGDWSSVRAHKCETAAAFQRYCTGWKRPPGRPNLACPGVVITCCSSAPESRDAVACSEVPAFRYEPALGPAEQEMAEHGMSVHCP